MLNYGKCLIILKQIYVFAIITCVVIYGFYYNINRMLSVEYTINNHNSNDINHTINNLYTNNNLSWDELIKDCGAYVIIENSARANEVFNRKYLKRVVEWKGYFINAYVQNFNPFEFNPDHLVNINVRMIPSESMHNPDLVLSMNNIIYMKYANVIRSLVTGRPIAFKAEMEYLGNEWKPHHLHLIDLKLTEDFIDHDHKVVLFKGINFNITGHLKNEQEMADFKISQLESKDDR